MEYRIVGSTMPLVEMTLEQGEKICSQPGAMKWMTQQVTMETSMSGGMFGALKRKVSGEQAFFNYYQSQRDGEQIAFGHTFPGHIVPIQVDSQSIICQKRAFLCSEKGVQLDVVFQKKLGTAFFGGEGFVMQKISGEGMAFLEIDGECVEYILEPGQVLKVETGAVGMFEEAIQFEIERVKGVKNILFGGEGLFLTTLSGGREGGKVWLQTMPIQSMAAEMSSFLPKSSSSK